MRGECTRGRAAEEPRISYIFVAAGRYDDVPRGSSREVVAQTGPGTPGNKSHGTPRSADRSRVIFKERARGRGRMREKDESTDGKENPPSLRFRSPYLSAL